MSLNQDHKDKFAQSLNESFEKWDAGSPNESLWSKLDASIENNTSSLNEAFEKWESEAPATDLWSKLDASLDNEINANRTPRNEAQSIGAAFNDWNPDAPKDLWSKLDEELSTANVWDKLSTSLDNETGSVIDEKFLAAYQEWSTGTNHDGWSKLEESLSCERVWNRLSISLTHPVGLPSIWWKYVASFIAFTFLSFFMNDQVGENQLMSQLGTKAENQNPREINGNPLDNSGSDVPVINVSHHNNLANNLNIRVNGNNPIVLPDNSLVNNGNNPNSNIANNSAVNNRNSSENNQNAATNNTNSFTDELAFLQAKGFGSTDNCSNVGRTHFYEPQKSHLSLTMAFGTQLSQSNSSNGSSLRSTAPRPGLAADLTVSRHFGRWGIFQDFGYVSFTQSNGDFVKGRYQNSIQKLNTLQSTSGLFYSFNRFDVNAGVVFTRILNGLEQENDKIINVYNTNTIQTGINAGFTYNLSPRRDKVRYGIGAQYQWIPNISAGNTEFRDIQGLKIQAKISF